MLPYWLALPCLVLWLVILLLPWRPWSTRESLDAKIGIADLSGVTVLIPARNEADTISLTLSAISKQGNISKIILIDDQSSDNTIKIAQELGIESLDIITAEDLPEGWSGKLWALEQGRQKVITEYILLLDADIELKPGIVYSLLEKAVNEQLQLVSLMANLRMSSFLEKLLMPAFIYFFKLLYPFSISNSDSNLISAAAGGCILLKTKSLIEIGGFEALKYELIDDCALARKIKNTGGKTWLGLTHSAVSHRQYEDLMSIWEMIARTAYTQLRYSIILLFLCTFLLFIAFILPIIALVYGSQVSILLSIVTFAIIWGTYLPVNRYYSLKIFWLFTLPIAGIIYLIITWSSAFRHWNGKSAVWKDRVYSR
jgi:hopene-associated glycosyltransferase HpnB